VPTYLRAMALRHGSAIAGALRAAADISDEVLAKLATADTSKDVFGTASGREKLAALVDEIAKMEERAAVQLQSAAGMMA
jgi:hypothetical protein